MDQYLGLATLIFAAMAGIGSLIRVYQNERLWKYYLNRRRKDDDASG